MKTRLISGTCYVLLLATFYCLKIFVHDFCFDLLIYAFSILGTFEMLRAVKDKITASEKIVVSVFTAICVPACAVFEQFFGKGMHITGLCLFVLVVLLLMLLVFEHDETSLESIGVSLLSAVYPTFLLCLLTLSNHITVSPVLEKYGFNSDLLILFVFVISPCADSIAYVFGRFLKKYFPKKMAPKLSPNKTVIGGIGGLVGGMLGSLVIYFIYNALCGSFEQMYLWLPIYLVVGLVGAAATALGDLVESCIKRKVNLKDMGKIMPGHGGALDRIDGTLFTTIAVYIAFMIVFAII